MDLAVEKTRPAAVPAVALSIEEEEPPEKRIERMVAENPVVIFSRLSCCMCHVMRRLLSAVGVHPTVIVLEDEEMEMAMEHLSIISFPAVFIGGVLVGGLESLMGLHLSGGLVPRLRDAGALWI